MRILAIILNVLMLAAIAFVMLVQRLWIDPQHIPVFLLMLAAPIVSVVALLPRGVGSAERKAQEEGRRAESLRDAGAQPGAAPNGGPATRPGNSRVTEGPPSVS